MATKKAQVKGGYLENIHKPLYKLNHGELREILDNNWYPKANNALNDQRKIWDYSYLAYKGILLWSEINRKRRANQLGIYVNIPRTFMTIEGVRRNFNINKLRVQLDPIPGIENIKRNSISSFLNYDLRRGGTFKQVKDAGFYKLLYGNGFLYNYLSVREGRYGKIIGDISRKTAVVKNKLDKEKTIKYFGMVARAISPYKVLPDPNGQILNYNDSSGKPCNYVCLRDVKHITRFRRDWQGIIPDEILQKVQPGGLDMTNYEAVRETIDNLFTFENTRYPGTNEDIIGTVKSTKQYDSTEMVEERIWIGEDFLIVQAGASGKFCLISPNPNPQKLSNLVKLDNVAIPGEFWSMGEPYLLRYQQIEENRVHNAVLDTLHFAISSMIGINTQYLEDEFDTEIYPQKVWKLKAMPGVKIDEMLQAFQPSSNGIAPALKFMEEIKEVGQSTTSITDFVTGASKSIADTATEANKLSGASDLAIADKIKEMTSGALVDVAKIFLSMYPVAYDGEEMKAIFEKQDIVFTGKTLKNMSEEKLTQILKKYKIENVIFNDDINITEPQFTTIGDISLNRGEKLSQWSSAIDFGTKINEVAYATGDDRRVDTIKMGLRAMENFDVVGDPNEFLISNQPTKIDEARMMGEMNQQNKMNQGAGGGAPKKSKITKPQTSAGRMRQTAQPTNRGKNQASKKNL